MCLMDSKNLPITLATTLLLGRSWVLAGIPSFGEVAWKMLLWCSGAVGESSVVTIVALVCASHYFKQRSAIAELKRSQIHCHRDIGQPLRQVKCHCLFVWTSTYF